MTKALFLPVMALVSIFSFSGTSSVLKKHEHKTVTKASPGAAHCSPWYTFIDETPYTVALIRMEFPNSGPNAYEEFPNPTFPFTYHGQYGGLTKIYVSYISSQAGQPGTVRIFDIDDIYLDCESFTSPSTTPLEYNCGCTQFYIRISTGTCL